MCDLLFIKAFVVSALLEAVSSPEPVVLAHSGFRLRTHGTHGLTHRHTDTDLAWEREWGKGFKGTGVLSQRIRGRD